MNHWLAVAVPTPAHSGLGAPLTYRADTALAPGSIVRVPLGAREVLGVVWDRRPSRPLNWRPRCARWRACSKACRRCPPTGAN